MKKGGSGSGFPTVFDCWAAPNVKRTFIPRLDQLSADAFLFYGAGTDTTAYSLTCGTWGLIHNKDALTKLREELHNALGAPDPGGKLVSPSTLENLTYLVSTSTQSERCGLKRRPLIFVFNAESRRQGEFAHGHGCPWKVSIRLRSRRQRHSHLAFQIRSSGACRRSEFV